MAKVDPRDFLLNTDYELDKIALVKTGSYVGSIQIPHNLSFTPLPFGIWSTDEDFTTTHALGAFETSGEPGYTPPLGVECIAQPDKITLTSRGEGNNTTRVYYRLYGFEPSDINENAPTTSEFANTFQLNTDFNYRKLKATGEFTQTGQSFAHNLGYLPQVMAWSKYADSPDFPAYRNGIEPITSASYFTNYKLEVTPTIIQTGEIFEGLEEKIIWRIYYDEA